MENEVGQISNQTHYYKVFGRGNSWEVSIDLSGGVRRWRATKLLPHTMKKAGARGLRLGTYRKALERLQMGIQALWHDQRKTAPKGGLEGKLSKTYKLILRRRTPTAPSSPLPSNISVPGSGVVVAPYSKLGPK